MPSTKRKFHPHNDSFARPKSSTEIDGPPSKRSKKDDSLAQTRLETRGLKTIKSASIGLSKTTGANGEEAAFPRGGASILTPLERKQIHIEAERDVLFELQNTPRKQGAQDEDPIESEVPSGTAKKRRSRVKIQNITPKPEDGDELVKIEGLSYKVFTTC